MDTETNVLVAPRAPAERRRSKREDVRADVLMLGEDSRLSGIRLLNLSEDGFMAVTDTDQENQGGVAIDLPVVGWCQADIVWVLGDRVGAAFRRPLDPHALHAVVREFGR